LALIPADLGSGRVGRVDGRTLRSPHCASPLGRQLPLPPSQQTASAGSLSWLCEVAAETPARTYVSHGCGWVLETELGRVSAILGYVLTVSRPRRGG
jgi:hypothetical protein